MAKSRLITTSLVGAVEWLRNGPASWRDKARKDLSNQLSRAYSDEMPIAMKRGIDFENAVYACARREATDLGTEHFQWFVRKVLGAQFQRKCKQMVWYPSKVPTGHDARHDDEQPTEYCLYGKIDAFKPTRIYDIKTTGEWKGAQKYLDGFQHKLYCHIEHVADFSYLVAEMASVEGKPVILATYEVEYHVSDFDALAEEVERKVLDVMAFLSSDEELFALYRNKFCLY